MLSRADAKLIRGLHRRKNRERDGLFLAEGVRVVEELARSGIDLRFAVASPSLEDTERGRALAATLEERGVLHRIGDAELAALAATETPQGILAVASIPRAELGEIVVQGAATVLVLDGVQDPGNFGTLVRSADAFAAAFVAVLPGTVDPWNPKAVRAAAGSAFHLPIVAATAGELLEWLGERGFAIYGADARGESVEAAPLAQRAALVLGNEGAGLSEEVRRAVDRLLSIPIRGRAESLNVGVAAGILLYLLTRRR
ncbi:MAG: RNA methyltransferase [Gemmatimonadetes bacterium]|nr:RNA methyltransferase [Gemmatimonadota bacterium]